MKANKVKKRLPRLPKVLADELFSALSLIDVLGHEHTMELLARYRRNCLKRITHWGISNIGAKVNGLEPIPSEHLPKIERLDAAFKKFHAYRNGGAEDYVATDVERSINRLRAAQPRSRIKNYEEIGEHLRRFGYLTSDNKKALVSDAASYFGVSESTIQRAIKAEGLIGMKRSTVT